jgi:hypothetical protein
MTAADRRSVFIVHSLPHAVAALEAAAASGCEIILLSAPDAGGYAGSGWFRELVAAARAAVPAGRCTSLLDCGDDPGAAQAAIRAGIEGIVFTGRHDVADRLAAIAAERGLTFVTARPEPALDLAAYFFADVATLRARCADALASPRPIC